MSQFELLKQVVETLELAQIPYLITGSMVSSIQGEPRLTHDIDIVVELKRPQVRLLKTFFTEPTFYLDEQSMLDAIAKKHEKEFSLFFGVHHLGR